MKLYIYSVNSVYVCICDVFRLMNLEKMFQFPYEVFFVIWYDSVYHIQYIHLYMSAQ